MEKQYTVSGMTCGGCAASVTRAIQAAVKDVRVSVDWEQSSVVVTGDHRAADIRRAVENAGFTFSLPS